MWRTMRCATSRNTRILVHFIGSCTTQKVSAVIIVTLIWYYTIKPAIRPHAEWLDFSTTGECCRDISTWMLCFSDKINELLVYRDLLAVKVTVRFKLPSCVGLGSSGWCRSMDVSVIDWCVCRCLLRMHCCRLASDFGDHSATDVTG
jgi:hypothetical protein